MIDGQKTTDLIYLVTLSLWTQQGYSVFLWNFFTGRSPEQRLLPATTAAQLVNTPDMIETTERLSRVLKEINLEGNRAQLTTQDSCTVKYIFPALHGPVGHVVDLLFILMRMQIWIRLPGTKPLRIHPPPPRGQILVRLLRYKMLIFFHENKNMLEVDNMSKADLGRYKSLLKGRKPCWVINFGQFHTPGSGSWSTLPIRIRIQDSQINVDPRRSESGSG